MRLVVRRVVLSLLFFTSLLAFCPLHGQTQNLDELLESARAAQSIGNYANAAGFYRRATAFAPTSSELWSNRGVMEFLAGQMDASKVSLRQALKLNPDLFTPLLFLGKVDVQTGKPAQALLYLNRAHALSPKDPEVLLTLGKASADLNQQRRAALFYGDATQIAPENSQSWLGLGAASLEIIAEDGRNLATSAPQSTWARALYADELFAQDRHLEATDIYKAAMVSASPVEKEILGRNLEWMQSHPDQFPLSANSQAALSRLAVQNKVEQGNTAMPCTSSERQNMHPVDLATAAACAYLSGDYGQSAVRSWKLLQQYPHSAEALYWSVKANERLAVVALSQFEQLAPRQPTNYVLVGDLYRYQREPDSAISEYKKALAIDARDPAALMGATVAYLSIGKLNEAARTDQAALLDRPLDPQLNLLMAEIMAAQNRYDEVKLYLAKCANAPLELQPRVHLLLGRAASEEGETQEAIHQFEMALPGDEDGSIHYQLSRLYRKAGNLAQAKRAETEAKILIGQRRANAVLALRETVSNP